MKISEKIKDIGKAAAILAIAVLIISFPVETAESTVNSINICISSIIPSMFAFMVVSSYIQNSGLYKIIFRPVLFLARRIIRADDNIISVFLLSLFGGYPIGVKLLSELIAQNNNSPAIKKAADKSAAFCYCISPTFAIIMIGKGVFGSMEAGAVIYISNVLSCLIMAIIISRANVLRCGGIVHSEPKGITYAINSASHSLFVICTVIIAINTVISCVTAILLNFGITVSPLILGLFEISNLLKIPYVSAFLIPFVSAAASFGGICVLMQCSAIIKNRFSVKKFLLFRIPCSLLSGAISYIIFQFTDISVTASSTFPIYSYSFSADKIIVLVLIAMCIIIFNKSDKFLEKV